MSRDPKAKNALLRAAEQMFAERGVAGTSVGDIAKLAGLSEDAFYLHFESKTAALEHIIESWIARCTSLFAGPGDYPDAPIDPDAVLDFVIERDVQIHYFVWQSRLTIRVLHASHAEYGHLFEGLRADMQRRSRQWLARWRQDGLLRPEVDLELAALLVSGAHEELSRKVAVSELRPPLERWLEQTQEFVVRALGTPEMIAALERRTRRSTTGIQELTRAGQTRARSSA